jgi:hypothetical protein
MNVGNRKMASIICSPLNRSRPDTGGIRALPFKGCDGLLLDVVGVLSHDDERGQSDQAPRFV